MNLCIIFREGDKCLGSLASVLTVIIQGSLEILLLLVIAGEVRLEGVGKLGGVFDGLTGTLVVNEPRESHGRAVLGVHLPAQRTRSSNVRLKVRRSVGHSNKIDKWLATYHHQAKRPYF